MASRHHSLDLSEVKDIIQVLQDFEEHNGIAVTFSCGVLRTPKAPRLHACVDVWPKDPTTTGPARLTSARLTTSDISPKTMNGLVTHLLYIADGKLALREMRGDEEPSA